MKTARLILREWQEEDLQLFAALNADPRVREFFPSILQSEESNRLVECISDHIRKYGWGFWAVSLIETNEFIGFIGLGHVPFEAHFTPAVEIGWRLAFKYWGKGYATEGAQAALAYGFETLDLNEIVAFTAIQNMRSRRIMEKIGMHHNAKDDFDHPHLAKGHPLQKHVLYRISQPMWRRYAHQQQKYVYKPYSKSFPHLFQKEKNRIVSSLIYTVEIEHVGSTAIPGLGGKGIIDIAIAVSKQEMEHTSHILQQLGYEFRPAFSTPERRYFVAYLADSEEGSRRYHIHLTYPSSKDWQELIGFRDYLRSHPEAAEEYASIKKQAVALANQDGEKYRKMKEPIFQKIKAFTERFHEK